MPQVADFAKLHDRLAQRLNRYQALQQAFATFRTGAETLLTSRGTAPFAGIQVSHMGDANDEFFVQYAGITIRFRFYGQPTAQAVLQGRVAVDKVPRFEDTHRPTFVANFGFNGNGAVAEYVFEDTGDQVNITEARGAARFVMFLLAEAGEMALNHNVSTGPA